MNVACHSPPWKRDEEKNYVILLITFSLVVIRLDAPNVDCFRKISAINGNCAIVVYCGNCIRTSGRLVHFLVGLFFRLRLGLGVLCLRRRSALRF